MKASKKELFFIEDEFLCLAMESREHVYLRLFSDEMSRAIKRRKGDAPLVVGSPPFAFRRVRLFGIVVELQHADSSSWLSLDDATGVCGSFFFLLFFCSSSFCFCRSDACAVSGVCAREGEAAAHRQLV